MFRILAELGIRGGGVRILRRQQRQRQRRTSTMLIATTNDLPGYEITEVLGEVFGLTVRSRNAFSQMGSGLKSMFGGELKGDDAGAHGQP
jgi:hypothetical protein